MAVKYAEIAVYANLAYPSSISIKEPVNLVGVALLVVITNVYHAIKVFI
jgi:hypothetical protein